MLNRFDKYTNLKSALLFAAAGMDAGMSLADFAEMQTDDIKALKTLLFPQGVVAVRVTQAQLGEREAKEGIDEKTGMPFLPLFYTEYKYEVLEADFVDKSLDAESYAGRILTHAHTFWPSNFKDQIALLKGRYAQVGFANTGKVGGMEGGEPGWIDNAVDRVIQMKIRHGKEDANGNRNVFYDWVKALDVGGEEEAA